MSIPDRTSATLASHQTTSDCDAPSAPDLVTRKAGADNGDRLTTDAPRMPARGAASRERLGRRPPRACLAARLSTWVRRAGDVVGRRGAGAERGGGCGVDRGSLAGGGGATAGGAGGGVTAGGAGGGVAGGVSTFAGVSLRGAGAGSGLGVVTGAGSGVAATVVGGGTSWANVSGAKKQTTPTLAARTIKRTLCMYPSPEIKGSSVPHPERKRTTEESWTRADGRLFDPV